MPPVPLLRTPRLTLEPFAERFLTERYVGWLNDPDVVRYSENRHRTHSLESCREYAASFAGSDHFLWAIETREVISAHIGNINAYVDAQNRLADVGILIGEKTAWGRGYGAEAWTAVTDYLMRVAGMRKVSAGTLATNTGMLSIMRRVGMRPDGIRERHYVLEGEPVGLVHMALFREDWLAAYPRGPFEGAA